MKSLDELLSFANRPPRMFHPVHQRSERAWFPGNEAASLVVQWKHIWEDVSCLCEMHNVTVSSYERKLLIKYAVVEMRSLTEVIDRVRRVVMYATVFNPRLEAAYRGITEQELVTVKQLFKEYSTTKASTERLILEIRNNIGAHRGNIQWQAVMAFWDAITKEVLAPLMTVIPEMFEVIKELNIYEWNRSLQEGTIEFLGGRIV